MTEFFLENGLFRVEVVIGVHNLIRKISLLLVFLELSDLNQEVTNIADQVTQTHEGWIADILFELVEEGVLTVSVAIIEIDDAQQQCLIEEFSPSKEVFFEDAQQ